MPLKSNAIFLITLFIAILLSACVAVPPHTPVPELSASQAVVEGFKPNIRTWGDSAVAHIDVIIAKRIALYQEQHADYFKEHQKYPTMNYLALSGGGYDGAFGAGVLCGWSKTGTRPEFSIVTGVSAGALIAPFAFAGPEYDDELRQVYTTLKSENIFLGDVWTVLDGITGGLALTDSSPLSKKIEEVITPELFKKIGEEHLKGRRLLIATTNLEAQRSVIWDIGSMANSGNPKALQLFRDIMLASASIPGAFKPVFIDVTIDGKKYQEIHADGGVTSQVFLYPLQTMRADREEFVKNHIDRNLYIIRNSKITPEYQAMNLGLVSLTQRSVETLIKNQGIGDLYRLYIGAYRDGIDYNLMYLPSDFKAEAKEIFDPVYMSKLFDVGYTMGQNPGNWLKTPPGVTYTDD